ncbi:carboxymuconolactone decarboxylase family protein [Chloroflexota bacterium]
MSDSERSEKTINTRRQYYGDGPPIEPIRIMLEVFPDIGVMTDEYLLGDIMSRPGLSMRERSMIIIATLLMIRFEGARGHMNRALNVGISREEVIEIILQVAPYGDWPVGNEIFSLIELAYPGYLQTVKENPFSNAWSHPELSLRERTMVTMACLIARRFSDRLKAHMRWALNIGLSREEILEVIMQVTPFSGWPVGIEAIRVAKDVFSTKE